METVTMDAATARDKIIHFIEAIEDTRVINLYEFLKVEIDEDEAFHLSDELKAELDQIDDDLDNGKMYKFTTQEQFRNYVKEKING